MNNFSFALVEVITSPAPQRRPHHVSDADDDGGGGGGDVSDCVVFQKPSRDAGSCFRCPASPSLPPCPN